MHTRNSEPIHGNTFALIFILTATATFSGAEDSPMLKAIAEAPTESFKCCIYDVEDLVKPVDFPMPAKAARASQSSAVRDDSQLKQLTKHVLAILNREKSSTLELIEHSFVITTSPDIHKRIVSYLSNLRKERDTQILFNTQFLSVDSVSLNSLLEKYSDNPGAIFKNEAEIKSLKDATVTIAPQLLVFNGQRSHIIIGTFDGPDTDDISQLNGIALEVRPILSTDRRTITVEAKTSVRSVDQTFQMTTKVSQADGATAFLILGGVPRSGQLKTQCLVIRTSVIVFDTEP